MSVLSYQEKLIFEMVNFVCLCSIVCLLGIVANSFNVIIFYKQGFKNTVNIGFFGLAISDLICLITLQWGSICMNPLLTLSGVLWLPNDVMYLTGGWPHVCFSRITGWITVYITAERYLSIALPLQVKQIITPKTVVIILCLICFINVSTLFPEYATSYLDWRFDQKRNKTLISILFTSIRTRVEGVIYVLHSILGMASFAGVILFTILLVMKLRQSSQWRRNVTSSKQNIQAISNRDKKTLKMVAVIASVLIGCYTPGAVIALAAFTVGPEFSINGTYADISAAMWSIACVFQAINSSINILFYYSMSSKYRQTFDEVILRVKKLKSSV